MIRLRWRHVAGFLAWYGVGVLCSPSQPAFDAWALLSIACVVGVLMARTLRRLEP